MKSIIRSLAFNILACIGLICCSHLAIAQSMNSADLRGSVTDATGALIPGVQVSVLNVDTGVEKIVSTNASGLYRYFLDRLRPLQSDLHQGRF